MPDLLIVLVTLAAQHDHIVLLCVIQRPADGLHAIFYHLISICMLHPLQDIADNGAGQLCAGIVGGLIPQHLADAGERL